MQRTRLLGAGLVALLLLGTAPALATGDRSDPLSAAELTEPLHQLPGLGRLAETTGTVTAIASLDSLPTPELAGALGDLGLDVQPLRHLPLAIVRGPVGALRAAVTTGLAHDVYPDEPIELLDTTSSDAMGAASLRQAGLTGKGVTVAVVDSGCDATHPDLADHVTHNVKLVSPEYVNGLPDSSTTIVVPVEQLPYTNSDLGSGHGTHVAGIIAADGTTGADHLGVAPDAELVCLSIGEVLFTTAVVTAYDVLLDQPDLWGVDVINNSWGNSYAQFDPRNPVAVATKAVADQGVTVVFAAGNAGEGNGEGTLNPFSQSPWVLSVAAETVDHTRGSFSSNGMRFDNSTDAPTRGGRITFTGDQIGLVHPDVTAPGVDISSTCDTVGAAVGPCPPGENAVASGTSMASPHVAGAVAVLRQANPRLSPTQIRRILQVTADPVQALGDDGEPAGRPAPFWQVGYGRVDLAEAVQVARSASALQQLEQRQRRLNSAVLAASGFRVLRDDVATWDAPRVSLGTDVRSFEIAREATASHLKVTVVFPADTLVGLADLTQYSVTVTDAAGRVLVGGTTRAGLGSGSAFVTVPAGAVGPYTVTVTGDQSVSDPDTLDSDSVLGDTVTVQVVQLRRR